MPGLINAHMHFYSTLVRGLGKADPARDFDGVLRNLWWRLDRKLSLDDTYYQRPDHDAGRHPQRHDDPDRPPRQPRRDPGLAGAHRPGRARDGASHRPGLRDLGPGRRRGRGRRPGRKRRSRPLLPRAGRRALAGPDRPARLLHPLGRNAGPRHGPGRRNGRRLPHPLRRGRKRPGRLPGQARRPRRRAAAPARGARPADDRRPRRACRRGRDRHTGRDGHDGRAQPAVQPEQRRGHRRHRGP